MGRSHEPGLPEGLADLYADRIASGVLVCDLRGAIVDCNLAATEITGLERDEIVGGSVTDLTWLPVAPFFEDGRPRDRLRCGARRAGLGEQRVADGRGSAARRSRRPALAAHRGAPVAARPERARRGRRHHAHRHHAPEGRRDPVRDCDRRAARRAARATRPLFQARRRGPRDRLQRRLGLRCDHHVGRLPRAPARGVHAARGGRHHPGGGRGRPSVARGADLRHRHRDGRRASLLRGASRRAARRRRRHDRARHHRTAPGARRAGPVGTPLSIALRTSVGRPLSLRHRPAARRLQRRHAGHDRTRSRELPQARLARTALQRRPARRARRPRSGRTRDRTAGRGPRRRSSACTPSPCSTPTAPWSAASACFRG